MFIKRTRGGSKTSPIYYLQLVESYRDDNGKPKHKTLCTLGREDDLLKNGVIEDLTYKFAELTKKLIVIDKEKEVFGKTYIFGPIIALESIWNKLGLSQLLEDVKNKYRISFDFEKSVKLMILNRLTDPKSKLSINKWKKKVYSSDFEEVDLQHLYRSIDILDENRDILQKELYKKTISLFKTEVKLVFYDLTTIYFESQIQDILRKYGYSKDNKTDCVQVLIGLIVNQDNIPIGYEIFEGNKSECKTVSKIIEKVKKNYEIEKIVFVGDKGILSNGVLTEIRESGYEYIVAAKLPMIKKSVGNVKRYDKLGEGIWVSEVKIDEKQRIILGYSEKRAERDRYMREELIRKLVKKIDENPKEVIFKPSYSKYLEIGELSVKIDEEKIKEQSKWDGHFGYITNTKSEEISTTEIFTAYHLLWQIEESFRCLKSTLDLRPIYHWIKKRIGGHIMLCFLSFYILRVMQKYLSESGIELSPEKLMESLDEIKVIEVLSRKNKFFARTEIKGLNNQILRALGCKIPSLILKEVVVE